jgi:hypothetical protein
VINATHHGLGPRSTQGSVTIRWSIFHLETSLRNTSRFGVSLSVTRLLCRVYRSGIAKPGKAVRFKRSPLPATHKSSSCPDAKSTRSGQHRSDRRHGKKTLDGAVCAAPGGTHPYSKAQDWIFCKKNGALVNGSQKQGFLSGFIPPLIVAAVIAVGLLIYYRQYGDSASRYDSAMSNCVRQRTVLNKDSTAREEATASCTSEIPERP